MIEKENGKKVKWFLFIDDMTIWWKQPKKSTKKLLEVDLKSKIYKGKVKKKYLEPIKTYLHINLHI